MKMRSERFQSLALATLLAIGAGLVWGILAGWAMSIVSDIASSGNLHEQLVFLRDGTPIIESYVGRNYQAQNISHARRQAGGSGEQRLARHGQYRHGTGIPEQTLCRLGWSERIACVYNDWYGSEVWYFIHDGKLRGHGYFVGYDKKARAKIGYIGANGFQAEEPPLGPAVPGQRPQDGRRRNCYGASMSANVL